MDTLYITRASGNCHKPFLAYAQSGRPVKRVVVDVLTGETRGSVFRALNPIGAVPYLVTACGTGIRESNAMLWAICDGTDLMPQTAIERALSLQWMFFEQTRLEPFISPARFLSFVVPERGAGREAEIEIWRQKARDGLAILDSHLRDNAFMLGHRYGITDIAVFGYVHLSGEAGIALRDFPSVEAWIGRVEASPGFAPLSGLHVDAEPLARMPC